MNHVRYIRHTLSGAVVAVALVLSAAAVPAPAAQTADPVWDLQQALQVRSGDLEDPASLKQREAALEQIIDRLRTISELRRALTLTGWRDEINEPTSVRIVEPRPGLQKRPSELIEKIDREARKKVGERLAKLIQAEAANGDATTKLAVAQLLAEMGTSVRGLGETMDWHGLKVADWRGYTRRFAPTLIKLTQDPNPAVRVAAARALGRINPDVGVAVPALQHLIQKGDLSERRAAAEATLDLMREIGRLVKKGRTQTGVEAKPDEVLDVGGAVVPAAGAGIEDRDPAVRRLSLETLVDAAMALSNLIPEPFDPKEVPPRTGPLTPLQIKLVQEFAKSLRRDEATAAPFVTALASQGDRLARALNDPDPEARLLARRALELMANARLRQRRRWESLPNLKTLEGTGASTRRDSGPLAPGFTLAAAQDKNALDRDELLRKAFTPGLMVIAKRLEDPDPAIRRATIDFLEMLEDAAAPALPALIRALSDPDTFVRWSAARTLGRIDPELARKAIPALARLLKDRDLDVRLAAAATLEAYGAVARSAVPVLTVAVMEGDPEFRRAVMYALQSIGPEAAGEAVPNLASSLSNDDPRVRRTAAETLGRFGPAARSAVPALRQALRDEDPDVRQAVSDALLSIQPASR
jgi:HEAT repeat protein